MTKDIFSPILAFAVLAGGTVAMGSELFRGQPEAAATTITLPMVMVTGKRAKPTLLAAQAIAQPTQVR